MRGLNATVLATLMAGAVVAGCGGDKDEASAGACPILPKSSHWNRPVDKLPVVARSDAIVDSIGRDEKTHADFGAAVYQGAPIGIHYSEVSPATKRVPVFFGVSEESDRGPYPIPKGAPIEGGPNGDGDRHVISIDRSDCKLYELFSAFPKSGGKSWKAESGAVWDLRSNKQRTRGFTSADAAGLPIYPGLAQAAEVKSGKIGHALRITVPTSRQAFIYPASHFASDDTDPNQPAMGQRLRIKASFDSSDLPPQSKVIVEALKRYGAIVADNGSAWFISGAPSKGWDDDDLQSLGNVPGDAWEVVDSTKLGVPAG